MRFLSGGAMLCLMLASLALSACGQRGPLLLPSEASKNNDKASYILYAPKKEAQPSAPQNKATPPAPDSVAPVADSK